MRQCVYTMREDDGNQGVGCICLSIILEGTWGRLFRAEVIAVYLDTYLLLLLLHHRVVSALLFSLSAATTPAVEGDPQRRPLIDGNGHFAVGPRERGAFYG